MTKRGHNLGPPLDDDAADRLVQEIARLKGIVGARARARVHRSLGSGAMSTTYAPSRVMRSKRLQTELAAAYAAAEAVELAMFQPQISWLQRKLERLTGVAKADDQAQA